MKTFFSVITHSTLLMWRDKMSLFILVVFPIGLIMILGNALASVMEGGADIDPVPCALTAESAELKAFLSSDDIGEVLQFTELSEQQALSDTKSGKYACSIIEKNGGLSVIVTDSKRLSSARIAYSILDGYQSVRSAYMVRVSGGDTQVLTQVNLEGPVLERTPLTNKIPSAIDYYAVTMTVMILLYSGLYSLELFNQILMTELGPRIRVSPVSRLSLVGGLLTSATITGFLQALIVVSFSALVYKANWGSNIVLVLLSVLVVCVFAQTFCLFVLLLTGSGKAAAAVTHFFIFFSTFVSGGYVQNVSFGSAQKVFDYLPNALVQRTLFGTIYGSETPVARNLLLVAGASAVLLAAAIPLLRRVSK